MARLPRFRRSVGVPGSIGGGQVRPGDTGAGQLAQTVGAVGQGVLQVGAAIDEIQKTKESAWITRATGEAEIFASELENRLETESEEGAPGHVDSFRSEWEKYSSGVSKAAPSGRARRALEARLIGVEVNAVRRRSRFQAAADLTKRNADFEAGIGAHIGALRNSPERLPEVLPIIQDDVAAASEWRGEDSITSLKAMESAAMGFAEGGDFDSARDVINEIRGEDESFAMGVDFAVNEIEADGIREDDGLDEARVRGFAEAEGFDLFASGEMTPEWIDANESVIGEQMAIDLRSSLKINGETQPIILADLVSRATEDGVLNEAVSAIAAGILTQEDFQALHNASRMGGPALSFRKQIERSLRPGQFDDAGAYVEAVQEYDEFVASNPEATKDQLRGQADKVISAGQARVADDLRATLPIPMFVSSARAGITIDVIRNAATSLAGALQSGKLTPQQAAAEAKKLRKWAEMLEGHDGRN